MGKGPKFRWLHFCGENNEKDHEWGCLFRCIQAIINLIAIGANRKELQLPFRDLVGLMNPGTRPIYPSQLTTPEAARILELPPFSLKATINLCGKGGKLIKKLKNEMIHLIQNSDAPPIWGVGSQALLIIKILYQRNVILIHDPHTTDHPTTWVPIPSLLGRIGDQPELCTFTAKHGSPLTIPANAALWKTTSFGKQYPSDITSDGPNKQDLVYPVLKKRKEVKNMGGSAKPHNYYETAEQQIKYTGSSNPNHTKNPMDSCSSIDASKYTLTHMLS